MNRFYYIGGTIIVYLIEIILAIIVSDVGVIFQFGAALAGSSVQFIWPGWFFLHAEKKYGDEEEKKRNKMTRFFAWVYIITGLGLFVSLLSGTIYNIIMNSKQSGGLNAVNPHNFHR
jgi:hypothetical protein